MGTVWCACRRGIKLYMQEVPVWYEERCMYLNTYASMSLALKQRLLTFSQTQIRRLHVATQRYLSFLGIDPSLGCILPPNTGCSIHSNGPTHHQSEMPKQTLTSQCKLELSLPIQSDELTSAGSRHWNGVTPSCLSKLGRSRVRCKWSRAEERSRS